MNKQTQCSCCIVCSNEPGMLAKVTDMLCAQGVNIDCLMVESFGSMCCMRFMCDTANVSSLRTKCEAAGFQMMTDQVCCVEMPNRPGELHKLTKMLAAEKVQVNYMYGASHGPVTKLVLCCDKPEAAARIAKDCSASMAGAA